MQESMQRSIEELVAQEFVIQKKIGKTFFHRLIENDICSILVDDGYRYNRSNPSIPDNSHNSSNPTPQLASSDNSVLVFENKPGLIAANSAHKVLIALRHLPLVSNSLPGIGKEASHAICVYDIRSEGKTVLPPTFALYLFSDGHVFLSHDASEIYGDHSKIVSYNFNPNYSIYSSVARENPNILANRIATGFAQNFEGAFPTVAVRDIRDDILRSHYFSSFCRIIPRFVSLYLGMPKRVRTS